MGDHQQSHDMVAAMSSQMYGLAIMDQDGGHSHSDDSDRQSSSVPDKTCHHDSESHEHGITPAVGRHTDLLYNSAYDPSCTAANRPVDDTYVPNEFGARVGPPLTGSSYLDGFGPLSHQNPYSQQQSNLLSSNPRRQSHGYASLAGRQYLPMVSTSSDYRSQSGQLGMPPVVTSSSQQGASRFVDSYIPNEFGARVGPPLYGHSFPPFTANNFTTAGTVYNASSHQQSSATTVIFSTATSTTATRPQ